MKALQINKYGGPEEMAINAEAPKPNAQSGQVVIEVNAASLNRIDTIVRAGYMDKMMPITFPATLGGDFAGVVSEVGADETQFKIGDEVYGQAGVFLGGSGSLAEYAVAAVGKIGRKPTSVNMVKAASLPLVGTSALQGIEEHLNIQSGQKILIQGGTGGIGTLAIQLAKLRGAYVATTVGTDEVDLAKSLGADEVIDYKTQDFTTILSDFDAVFVTAGDALNTSFQVLKKGGILVSMVGPADETLASKYGVTVIPQMTRVSSEQLSRLAELVDSGQLKPQVDKTFAFNEAKEAFAYFETGHPKGKVVVSIK